MDNSRLFGYLLLLVCVFSPLSTAIRPLYQSGQNSRDVNKIAGQWGKWGVWSSCSVRCGTGISSRTRRCEHPLTLPVASLIIRADDSVVCEGGGREIRVCNKHKCPPKVENVRQKQCRKFNARVFNGKKYEWEPYINPNNKCELTCRAKGQHFYARLANRVGDGTPCDLTSFSVCIRRKCIKVGCDDLVGSNATLDKCGVCNGDNSTCRTISGVFTRPDLPRGYTKITTIPAGSTGVNITELRPSNNYLSLRTRSKSVVNGNWTMSASGNYQAAGTTFIYKKQSRECPGECIFARGPLNQTIDVLMLVYHKNPGVMYSFNVPVDVTDAYFKEIISRSDESHVLTTVAPPTVIPSRTATVAQPELANLELGGPTDVDVEADKDDDEEEEEEEATEPFREDFVESHDRHPHEDLEEGVMARPDTKEDHIRGSFGQKEYTFHKGNGATVLLKANVESWSDRANVHEEQSQKGPTFVLSELGSKGEDEGDTSLEVVDGAAVLKQQRGEQMVETDVREEGGEQEGDEGEQDAGEGGEESEEVDDGGEQEREESDERNDEDNSESSHLGEKVNEAGDNGNVEIEGEKEKVNDFADEDEDVDDNEEEEDGDEEDEDGNDGDDDDSDEGEEEEEKEEEEPYDKSRGDEVLGLGDGFREREPVYNRRGYRLPNTVKAETETRKTDSSQGGYSPTTHVEVTTPATPATTVRGTLNVPQRDSRFRTYSRSLGRSSVQPAIRRVGRPFGRPGRRGSVRIPKYSQSFTFRERFKILRDAQKKRLLRQRQKLMQKSEVSSIAPSVNRRISSSSQLPSIQGTDTSRIRSQQGGIRHTSQIHGQSTTPRSHHVRHRHHHRQAAIVTTPPPQRRLGSVDRNSQGLRLGPTGERRVDQEKQRAGSSITLKANVNASPSDRDQQSGRTYRRNENQGVRTRDNQGHGSQTSNRRTSPGHQPSLNARVSHNIDRTINTRDPAPRPNQQQTPRRQAVDHRTIVDETLPLGHFDRALDPRGSDRRIVIPQQPVGVSTGQQIIPQQPVISSRPRYEGFGSTATQPGEPLTKYANGVDPLSGLPPLTPGGNQALTAGKSYTRNIIPNEKRLVNPALNGGLSNEVLGATYVWRVSGFTDCTTTCGGGVQQTVVVCVNTRNQAVVTDENCARLHKPAPTAVTCNTRPCPASWESSQWSTCTTTCGPGTQTRTATCKSRVSATLNLTMPDNSCSAQRPATAQTCEITACYLWITGNWSKCSSRCGQGRRQREVTCTDAAGTVVTSQLCTALKPANQENCNMGSCGKGWYSTQWPEECPASCGEGTMKRKTMCAGEKGVALDTDRCDQLDKPRVEKTCKVDTPCGGNWFVGEWSKCNGTCGYTVRSRDVACVKNLPGGVLAVVTEDNCKGKEKPETGEECQLPECHPEWYMTSWAECSKSCGTGYRTREVKCLDPNQQPSAECPARSKPRTREPCNTQSCVARPKPTSKSGGACTDSFSQCQLVKKARLCRYGYYAKMCCLSCSNET